MPKTAREKFLELVLANGWQPDTTATISVSRFPGGRESGRRQDPFTFVRPAAHGGQWRIQLDYSERGHSIPGNTLRKVKVTWVAPDAQPESVRYGRLFDSMFLGELKKHTYSSRALYDALANDLNTRSLRERAELLVKDPDTAVWLSFQAAHDAEIKRHKHNEDLRRELAEKARPLPITVGKDAWFSLSYRAREAALAVFNANGQSDLPDLVVKLREAVNNIEKVMK